MQAAIIDPGDDVDDIAGIVDKHGLQVKWVLLTHGHFDHSFRTSEIAGKYGCKIGMSELDVPVVRQSMILAEPFYDLESYKDFTPTDDLKEGDIIKLGQSIIQVVHTPGHSDGGLCFVTDIGVFCGDTVFSGSVGRTDLFNGSHETLIDSIHTKVMRMFDDTVLYPGHGPETTIGRERRYNPFLVHFLENSYEK